MAVKVVCIGSVLVDEIYTAKSSLIKGTSNPVVFQKKVGGVMTNIAQHLAMLEIDVELITVFGNDTDANFIANELLKKNVGLTHAFYTDSLTGKYVCLLSPDGSLYTAVVTDSIEQQLTPDKLSKHAQVINNADIVVADTNLSKDTLQWLIQYCRQNVVRLIIEPVSVPKAAKLQRMDLEGVYMITPNEEELMAIFENKINGDENKVQLLKKSGVNMIWIRKGVGGSEMIIEDGSSIHLDATNLAIKDATGAGDAALAAWIFSNLHGETTLNAMRAGHALAFEVLQQVGAVMEELNVERLQQIIKKYY